MIAFLWRPFEGIPLISLRRLPLAGLVLIGFVWGCGGTDDAPDPGPDAPVLQEVTPEPSTDPVRPDPPRIDERTMTEPGELGDIRTDTVRGWTGPGGGHFEVALRTAGRNAHLMQRIGQEYFPLAARVGDPGLTQYPCSACHEGEVALGQDRVPDAHSNVTAVHPDPSGTRCTFCHVADSVELLTLHEGATTGIDHAYQLCAQCHVSETRDWASGVHGKRLAGWYGQRVVLNCADCHDPHRPALEPRIPYPGPAMIRGGSP